MNKTTITGRLTKNSVVYHNAGQSGISVAKYTLAVRRPRAKEGQPTADFINCTAFGPRAKFAEAYLTKGTKVEISGSIHTGSYVNQAGQRVYTSEIYVEDQEFSSGKNSSVNATAGDTASDYGVEDLPFA